jgi:predicted DNA-binding protein
MAKNGKSKTISIRLPPLMLTALNARVISDEKDRTQIIREAINKYLDLSEESYEEKLQVLEQEQISLNKIIDKLDVRLQNESKRNDSIKTRVDELSRIIAQVLQTAL